MPASPPLTVTDLARALGLPATATKAQVLLQLGAVARAADTTCRLVALNSKLEQFKRAVSPDSFVREVIALRADVAALQNTLPLLPGAAGVARRRPNT